VVRDDGERLRMRSGAKNEFPVDDCPNENVFSGTVSEGKPQKNAR